MNEIKISLDRIRDGKIISNPRLDIQLIRVGSISYAVFSAHDNMAFFAFSSSQLTRYLSQLEGKDIIDVKLVNQGPITGDESDETKVLQLKLSNAKIVVLNKYDHLYEMDPVILEESNSVLVSAHKQWGLPAMSIAGFMLFTDRLIRTIEDIAEEGQHGYLVNVLWADYRLTLESTGSNETDRVCVEGEFISFSVKKFAHGLYVFDHV
jgi:hypothetical protein